MTDPPASTEINTELTEGSGQYAIIVRQKSGKLVWFRHCRDVYSGLIWGRNTPEHKQREQAMCLHLP